MVSTRLYPVSLPKLLRSCYVVDNLIIISFPAISDYMGLDEKILVVEFGSQYSHLIVKRVRRLGVYAELVYPDDLFNVLDDSVKGVILSGGPMSVYDESSPKIDLKRLLERGIPVLGICYGHQLISHALGGEVERAGKAEYGPSLLRILEPHPLLEGVPSQSIVWMSHGDVVLKPPDGFKSVGSTEADKNTVLVNDELRVYSTQFHPEVVHTEYGEAILRNFLYKICGCRGGYDPYDIVKRFIEEHRSLGRYRALVAVSGGVDSTVTAFILKEVFGENLHLVFLETGFNRVGEKEFVESFFREHGMRIHIVDVKDRFLESLKGVGDPEEKRRIFSRLYFETLNNVYRELEKKYGEFRFLGQGTLYPDVVESGATSKYTDRIKSHHNVVGRDLSLLEPLEPLKELYKDEVRMVAKRLGIPRDVYMKHPFPGPGYLVRVLGPVDEEKLRIVKEADRIVVEELKKSGLYWEIWQGFAALLSVKTVGVKGDRRSYEYAVAVRMVHSEDGMTAKHVDAPYDLLNRIANRILTEVRGVNRVLYDLSDKPPATIEYE